MASYIGQVQVDNNDPVLIGSTLYGICTTSAGTAAKKITSAENNSGKFINNHYDNLLQGSTIHVKFTQGNTVTSNITLQVGTLLTAQDVVGKCTCDAGTILSFTLDENQKWVVNDNVDTNTEYVFKTAYNASTNKALTESDIAAAAVKGVVTDLGANTSSEDLPTASAVASYVQTLTGGLGGLTGAMHFRGTSTTAVTDGGTQDPTINGYEFNGNGDNAGDVVLYEGKEFVWTGSAWELLGDEGSYALKSSTASVVGIVSNTFTANTLPTLTITDTTASSVTITAGSAANLTTTTYTVPEVTQAGTATTASVTAGVLVITLGQNTVLSTTPITIKGVDTFTPNTPTVVTATPVTIGSASNWSQGTTASLNLSTTSTIVVVPNSTP